METIELTPEGYDTLPQEVKHIIDTWDDDKELYSECSRIEKQLNAIGWDSDYGFSGDITEVWKLPELSETNLRHIIDSLDWIQLYPEYDDGQDYFKDKNYHIEVDDDAYMIDAHIEYSEDVVKTSGNYATYTPPTKEVTSKGGYVSINKVWKSDSKMQLSADQLLRLQSAIEKKLTF